MSDLFAEVTRFTVVLLLWVLLLRRTQAIKVDQPEGWRYILWGFFLLLLGSAIDITDEFETLERFVVIGDTPVQAFIEKIVCYLGGYVLLLTGFHSWLPVVMRAQEVNQQLQREMVKRKAMQTQLLEQNTQLKEAQEAALEACNLQSQFLANVTHNLRTPVHALQAYSELGLQDAAAGNVCRDYFERIYGSSQRMKTLVDDLLEIATLEGGKVELWREDTDLAAIINSVLEEEETLLKKDAFAASVRIQTQNPYAEVDKTVIQKVLHKLIGNVIHHAASGRKLELRLNDATLNRQPALELSCRDWGPGIEHHRQRLIFNKFVQAQNCYSNHPGTGLGLAICKELVKLHGGQIRAENHPNGGAVLTLTLYRKAVGKPYPLETIALSPSDRALTEIKQGGSHG